MQINSDRSFNPVRLERYFNFCIERHRVWVKRKAGLPFPWTEDRALQIYRFCNVYRELDTVTEWIRKNWREPYYDHHNLPLAMVLARLINWPPTLEEIGFPDTWRPNRVCKKLQRLMDSGEKVYTGAYMLGAIPRGMPRAEHFVHHVLTPIHRNPISFSFDPITLEGTWDQYRQRNGLGKFLAYEIVTDLRHTVWLEQATDIQTWANPGPGAIRGLVRLYGYKPKSKKNRPGVTINHERAIKDMRDLLRESRQRLPRKMPKWEMREVEHMLCEYDKYERILAGEGVLEKFVPYKEKQFELL